MRNLALGAPSVPAGAAELARALAALGTHPSRPAIVHASLSAFGYFAGGAPAVVSGLRRAVGTVLAPAFTYYTKVWPPERRAADWPRHPAPDGPAFRPDARVSPDVGRVAQALLDTPGACRTDHPALSFVAVGPDACSLLAPQSLEHPYAPIGVLYRLDGDVLLLGVDHTTNTSVHYGEFLAGRPLLERFVNAAGGIVRASFPNCSAGFAAIEPHLEPVEAARVGRAVVRRVRVRDVVDATLRLLREDPEALLCPFSACRCQAVRATVRRDGLWPREDGLRGT